MSISSGFRKAAIVFGCFASILFSPINAQAVPAFARQTGQACVACHVSFPELTPYGRYFKLSGYTLGERQWVPLAVMMQASITKTRNNNDYQGNPVNLRDGDPVFGGASVFLAGKATDNIGGFIQWTFSPLNSANDVNGNATLRWHSAMDNTDVRVTGKYIAEGSEIPDLLYGITIHNNPTVQDVWNSTPAFGFPFTQSPLAQTPDAKTQLDSTYAQKVVGMGAYAFWEKTIYAELSAYRNANNTFKFLSGGVPELDVTALDGYNPYWRLALNHEWGPHSIMLGTYGAQFNVHPQATTNGFNATPADRYTDYAWDMQYQYITNPHLFTFQATAIRENQHYGGTNYYANLTGGNTNNNIDRLNTVKAKLTYYYDRKYGVSFGYNNTTGSQDSNLYANNAAQNPHSTSYTLELNYLPIENVRLMLQYVAYTKFNGASYSYNAAQDSNGNNQDTTRNASDNNTLFANIWVAF